MLKITVEIIPFGDYSNRFTINSIYIGNTGGDKTKANYDVWFDSDPTDSPKESRPTPDVQIAKFKRAKGAIELLRKALNAWYSKQKKVKNDDI